MACSFDLYAQLGGTPDSGGLWTQTGGPQSVPPSLTNPQLGTVDFTGALAGAYTYDYIVGTAPCDDTSTVTITVAEGAEAGIGADTILCDSDASVYTLYNFLGGTPDVDGTWSGTGTTSPGYSAGGATPTDDTFQPSTAGVGKWTFVYTVNHGDTSTPAGCDNCIDTATIVITVTAAADAGTGVSLTVCN